MNEEEYDARLNELVETLVGLYGVIGKLFGLLPIPVSLPVLWDEAQDEGPEASVLVSALTRAQVMLMDLPVDPRLTAVLNMAVVEWLGALDMCALAGVHSETHEGDAHPYRLEVVWLATQRIARLTERATEHLHLDL